MSEKPVNSTPKRRSRGEASRLLEEYLKSGLSLKAFCQHHHLDCNTLVRPDGVGPRQNPSKRQTNRILAERWVFAVSEAAPLSPRETPPNERE